MKVPSILKKVAASVLSILLPVMAFAQTDDDIAVFLENVRNEVPASDDLDFYLEAGRRLLREGRAEEAGVFFDFAASLGNEEGFRGKAAVTKDPDRKKFYLAFSERRTPAVDKLISSLATAGDDVSAAILVHDNIETFRLDHLHDPLLDWMPSSPEDSAWLRRNDGMAYKIAKVKEDAGNRYGALLLYDIAAWEGNYEALLKARTIGTDTERKWKKVLIDYMDRKKEAVLLHRYLMGDELKGIDYDTILSYLSTPDERLISYAVGFPEPDLLMTTLGIQPTGDYGIRSLRVFVRDHPGVKYSKEAVSFIRSYYQKNPKPWAKRVLKIVHQLPIDKKKHYSRSGNRYYPLYEKGLFSRLHHTEAILPELLDPGL